MRDLRGTYVHRGDRVRGRLRLRRTLAGVACCTAMLAFLDSQKPSEARADWSSENDPLATPTPDTAGSATAQPIFSHRELALANRQLERWNRIFSYSNKYNIDARLAGSIHDIALAEGLEPDLAFRLVRLESNFEERAISSMGAVGLTQLMPATARYFEKGITREKLYDRDTNLRIGFRYLRTLIREYDGNLHLALLVYNRGPTIVERLRREGQDPSNGYERRMLRGYTGSGVVN